MFIKCVHYYGLFVNNWDVVWYCFCDWDVIMFVNNKDSIC